jgi:hypothetical protein
LLGQLTKADPDVYWLTNNGRSNPLMPVTLTHD